MVIYGVLSIFGKSCTTTTQSAPVASGLEMVINWYSVKQEGPGLLTRAICLLRLAEKEVNKSLRRKVKIIRFTNSFQILLDLFLKFTISPPPSYGFYGL